MPAPPTVLSHLAHRFSAHPENLATEALAFILAASPDARAALAAFAGQLGFAIGADLEYATQATNEEGSRPDLIGRDAGQTVVLVEAKFWAGLTDAQPNGYLRSLPGPGLLLFVTPAARVGTVWPELVRRATAGGFSSGVEKILGQDSRAIPIGSSLLAITSWRALLQHLLHALEHARDSNRAADLQQLSSLCEQMDSEAFLPLRSEELTSPIGRRIVQFGDLASDITDALVERGLAEVKGFRATGANGWFGRYMRLKQYPGLLSFNAERWANLGESPIWLELKGPDNKPSQALKDALTAAGVRFTASPEYGCLIAIELAANVEREHVVAKAVAQIVALAALLPIAPVPQTSVGETGNG